jgi:hypothetical protein
MSLLVDECENNHLKGARMEKGVVAAATLSLIEVKGQTPRIADERSDP